MEIDIRNIVEQDVDRIVFGNGTTGSYVTAYRLFKKSRLDVECVRLEDPSGFMLIQKNEISHLIKALQKAQELGWDK